MPNVHTAYHLGRWLLLSWLLLVFSCPVSAAGPLKISKAIYNKKKQTLTVTTSSKQTGPLELIHGSGGLLETMADGQGKHTFSIPLHQLGEVPCTVQISQNGVNQKKKVAGSPKECGKPLTCKILAPVDGSVFAVNSPVEFKASVSPKSKHAENLKYQWDFGGGVVNSDTKPAFPATLTGSTAFVRDNAVFRVRFVAQDEKGKYCEAAVDVRVGQTEANPPAKVAEQTMEKRGGMLEKDYVVLPFAHSAAMGQGVVNLDAGNPWPGIFHLDAVAYKKARLPVDLSPNDYQLFYSAGSNPLDPAGSSSINSTSQNYLANAQSNPKYADATIKKTEMWQAPDGWETVKGYEDHWLVDQNTPTVSPLWKEPPTITKIFNAAFPNMWGEGADWTWYLARNSAPDEGFLTGKFEQRMTGSASDADNFVGSFMPGKNQPYQTNQPQPFTTYDAGNQTFNLLGLPMTDMDDSGKINPYPVIRVQAKETANGTIVATADATLTTAKDVRCSECHLYGGIGSDPNVTRLLRPQKKDANGNPLFDGYGNKLLLVGADHPREPYTPPYINTNPQTLEEKEKEAFWNLWAIHAFIELGKDADGNYLDDQDTNGDGLSGGEYNNWENSVRYIRDFKMPEPCQWCHQSAYLNECGYATTNWDDLEYGPSEHRYHGRIQVDEQGKVIRDAEGRPLLWDYQAEGKTNPNSLFPVADKNGNKIPMEQNCLKCHVGASQKGYHDPMYQAGVQCADCHGDMLAVGDVFAKKAQGDQPRNAKGELIDPNKLDKEGNPTPVHRVDYLDQPDCGSCHTGKGMEAVKTLAYDPTDPAATPLLPLNERFAVNKATITFKIKDWDMNDVNKSYELPLFRKSVDKHGDVACGACHGATHAIWPIKNPKANENVTALQAQGHTGTILECNVCHTAEDFKHEAGGVESYRYGDGILAGPHNMHPVNDPYWWKLDTVDNTEQTGGLHRIYAQKPGQSGEDQCAACHGNDHKGTRLSKTPVDRTFNFSGLDPKTLKAAGIKKTYVTIKAGTFIGCDTCHTVETSCKNSPSSQCGD